MLNGIFLSFYGFKETTSIWIKKTGLHYEAIVFKLQI